MLTGGLYQQWYIAPQGNGYVAIVNASNYMVMDRDGARDDRPGRVVRRPEPAMAIGLYHRPTDLMVTREASSEGPGLQRSGPTYRMSNGVRCPMGGEGRVPDRRRGFLFSFSHPSISG